MLRPVMLLMGAIICYYANSQPEGDFPISDHKPVIFGVDHTIFDITFDTYGLMYTTNSSGVMQYDGTLWANIATPTTAFSIDVNADNRLYVGCLGSFGYLQLSESGMRYKSISPDTLGNEYFTTTKIIGDSVIFLSQKRIWTYKMTTEKLKSYASPDKFSLESLVYEEGKVYLSTEVASYLWEGSKFTESDTWIGASYPPKKVDRSPSEEEYVMLDLTNKLFYGKPGNLKQIKTIKYAVNDFEWVNDTLIVVSTKDHGCAVLNLNANFSEVGKIDYKRGLPDNEIMALKVDWNMGIWIGHQFGFSRVDPMAPVHCLSNQEGLVGNLITSIFYKGELLVGTSSGLFRSKHDSTFKITKRKAPARRSTKKKKRFFKRASKNQPLENSAISVKAFESAKWIYERVPEVNYKLNDFQIHGDVLLIGSNDGLFEYQKGKIKKILNQPVKEITSIPGSNQFLVRDQSGISRYLLENGEYIHMSFGENESLALSAYADRKGYVWVVNPGKLLSMGLTYSGATILQDLTFPNNFLEDPSIVEMKGKLYFVTTQGYFFYDYKKRTMEQDTALLTSLGLPKEHLEDDGGGFWIYDGKMWKNVSLSGEQKVYPYLSLYPDIRFIHQDRASEEIYFITENNQLFRYSPKQDRNEIYKSSVFYKHLFAKSAYGVYRNHMELNHDENYLRAEIMQPDYLGLLKVEYQYKLVGMDKEWSEWSPNNTINLNFLPEGKYELHARSRDVFDRMQSIEPIAIVIKPPYWQTTWFYSLEVIFFASLVMVSARLNQGKAQNRFLTQALTTLTIVMIIETLQSLAVSAFSYASSPVIDFAINLTIALVIFPLELILKHLITNGNIALKLKKKDKTNELSKQS